MTTTPTTTPTDPALPDLDLPSIVTLELYRELFGISPAAEYRQRLRGEGPTPIRITPRKIVFTRQAVERWFAARAGIQDEQARAAQATRGRGLS